MTADSVVLAPVQVQAVGMAREITAGEITASLCARARANQEGDAIARAFRTEPCGLCVEGRDCCQGAFE